MPEFDVTLLPSRPGNRTAVRVIARSALVAAVEAYVLIEGRSPEIIDVQLLTEAESPRRPLVVNLSTGDSVRRAVVRPTA
jgi:hypothetical protein